MKALYRYYLPLLILWLAFSLRLYHLDFQSIWWDEGHSLFVAGYPISQIPTLPAMDVHPPAYFALLHLWMGIAGQSEFALRYLSVIFSLLTVALLWCFAAAISGLLASSSTRLLGSSLAALLAALSPLYVAYAQEVRGYAMITFLAAASTFMLWQIIFSPVVGGRWSAVAGYILLTTACLYTHYFTLFLLLFQNLAWLAWVLVKYKKPVLLRNRVLVWLGGQLSIWLLFTPQLILALRQITTYTNPNLNPPTLAEFIWRSWLAYTTGLTIDSTPAYWGMAGMAVVMVIAWLGLLLPLIFHALRPSPPPPQLSTNPSPSSILYPLSSTLFLTGWLLVPLAAYYLVLQRQPSFEPRYLILVTPALFLLLALGLANLQSFRSYALRIGYYVLLGLTLIILVTGLHSYYTNETYFKDDSAGVADWLAAETTPTDLVYVDVPHPFHYYAHRIPAPMRYLFVDIHTVADTLTREAAGRRRLFWLTWRGSDTDPRGVIPFLAQKQGQKLGQRNFRGYHLEWYALPEDNSPFSLPVSLNPIEVTFGDTLRLDRAAFGPTASSRRPAWTTLHFTLRRDTEVNYKVSVRLRGEDGQIVAQVDKDLLNDRHFRTAAWPLDDPALNQAINVYTLPLAAEAPPGLYRLEVVVYNAEPPYPSEGVTGPAASPDGEVAVVGQVKVIP